MPSFPILNAHVKILYTAPLPPDSSSPLALNSSPHYNAQTHHPEHHPPTHPHHPHPTFRSTRRRTRPSAPRGRRHSTPTRTRQLPRNINPRESPTGLIRILQNIISHDRRPILQTLNLIFCTRGRKRKNIALMRIRMIRRLLPRT